MKKALSLVLSICMILGCFSVGFMALAVDGATLPDAVAAAVSNGTGSYKWTGGTVTLSKPIVIDAGAGNDFTLDLGGAEIWGANNVNAIEIKSGNVTVKNGFVVSQYGEYIGLMEGLQLGMKKTASAVWIDDGNVTLEGLTLVGGLMRFPSIRGEGLDGGKYERFPACHGIDMDKGHCDSLTINSCIVIGFEGIAGRTQGNHKEKFVISDSIIAGINEAVYWDLTYTANGVERDSFDILEASLQDNVHINPEPSNERKAIKMALDRAFNFCVVVDEPATEAPEFDYTDGVLTVTAKSDDHFTEYSDRHDYRYVPATVTILDQTAEFVETGAKSGDFVATFEGVTREFVEEAMATQAEIDWRIAFGMGERQYQFFDGMVETIQEAATETLPAFLDNVLTDLDRGVETLEVVTQALWNGYQDIKKDYPNALEEMGESVKKLLAAVIDLTGARISNVWIDDSNWYDKTFEDEQTWLASTSGYAKGRAKNLNDTYGSHLKYRNEKFLNDDDINETGFGFMHYFEYYLDIVKETLYGKPADQIVKADTITLTSAKIQSLAKIFGDDYAKIYEILKYYGQNLFTDLKGVLNDENVQNLLTEAGGDLFDGISFSQINGYINELSDYFDQGIYEIDIRRDNPNSSVYKLEHQYEGQVGNTAASYAGRAWTMLTDPTVYFTFKEDVDDTTKEYRIFDVLDQYDIPDDLLAGKYIVDVSANGNGTVAVSINGSDAQAADSYYSKEAYGANVSIDVNANEGSEFVGFRYTTGYDADGLPVYNFAQSIDDFKVVSNIRIEACFVNYGDDEYEISVIGNKALGYSVLGTIEYSEYIDDSDLPDLPDVSGFTDGIEFKGWALTADGTPVDDDTIVDLIISEKPAVVYAIYDAPETIEVPVTHTTITDLVGSRNGKTAYFATDIQAQGGKKILQAGIIASKNANLLNLDSANQAGVLVFRSNSYEGTYLKDNVSFSVSVSSSGGTIYAVGYVVYADANGNPEAPIYTEVASVNLD